MSSNLDDINGVNTVQKAFEDQTSRQDNYGTKFFKFPKRICLFLILASFFLGLLFYLIRLERFIPFLLLIVFLLISIFSVFGSICAFLFLHKKEKYHYISFVYLIVLSIITLMFVFVLLFLLASTVAPIHQIFFLSFLLLFIIPPLYGACRCVISLISRDSNKKFNLVLLLFPLLVAFCVFGRHFIILTIPYIYMPPVLTSENLPIYQKCIDFVKQHDNYEKLSLSRNGFISLDGANFITGTLPGDDELLDSTFSKEDMFKIKEYAGVLDRIMCPKFQRYKDMVIFYKTANSLFPMNPREFLSIFPSGHGVLYSLEGYNPNELENEDLQKYKPFIKVYGNWYMSRSLLLAGHRSNIKTSIPRTLIDNSLHIEGLNFKEEVYSKKQ